MDTKGLMFPKPKDMNKENKNTRKKQEIEFCIMPESKLYSTKRRWNLKRHEVFYGRIKDAFGPVIREKLEEFANSVNKESDYMETDEYNDEEFESYF